MEHLAMEPDDVIRLRAYFIWVDSGCEHGNDNAQWLAAENEIMLASMEAAAQVMALDIEISKPASTHAIRKSKKVRAVRSSPTKLDPSDIMGRTLVTARRPRPKRAVANALARR
jgi:Protein of unknown function (DUF2934)